MSYPIFDIPIEHYRDFGRCIEEELGYGILWPEKDDCKYWKKAWDDYETGGDEAEPPMSGIGGETLKDYFDNWGEPNEEAVSNLGKKIYVWEDMQIFKGQPRFNLFVADYGDYLLTAKS